MTGSRSSMGWVPVARGLYSANRRAVSTPWASRRASRRAGTGSPAVSKTSCHGSSLPYWTAQSIQAGLTVDSRGTCMWASVTGRPSIIVLLGDPAEAGLVGAGRLDVGLHRAVYPVGADAGLLDLRGYAGHQGGRRDLEAFGYQGRGGDDGTGAHPGPVQDDRTRSDQALVLDHAPFEMGVVPDHAVRADDGVPGF